MADKNRNGIEDSREKPPSKKFKPGQKTKSPLWGMSWTGQTARRAPESNLNPVSLAEFFNQPVRQGLNFLGDLTTGFQRNQRESFGTGLGDQLFGVQKGYYANKNANPGIDDTLWRAAWGRPNTSPVGSTTSRPPKNTQNLADFLGLRGRGSSAPVEDAYSFADALAEAMQLFGGLGGSSEEVGYGQVSYDPQRQAAQQNYNEADAHIGAIYRALASSIAADAGGIGQSYDEAIANQKRITDEAVQTTQQGYQSGNDMLAQQAAALGIQEAVANRINSGQANAGDMAQRVGDLSDAGATARTQLNTNRSSALDYNTAVKQAAEQEGAAQRAQRAAELRALLAQIDMAEQEANASAAASYRSSGADMGDAIGLAQWLFEQSTDASRYNDTVQRQAEELAIKRMGIDNRAPFQVTPESTRLVQRFLGLENDPGAWNRWIQENPNYFVNLAKSLG